MDDYGSRRFRKTVIILLSLVLLTNCIILTGFASFFGFSGLFDFNFNLFNRDKARENNITIAGEYKILSTENISDAYISGDYDSLDSTDRETLDMAIKVIDEVITYDMTVLEKEKAIYDYLINLTPSEDPLSVVHLDTDEYTPHGVLLGGSAVCVGYATTFRLFMQMLGINCMVCHNTDLGHSWDLVELDGEWYHVDCYMGSNCGNYQYFNVPDSVLYTYEDWNSDFFPSATGLKYNYTINNSFTKLDSIYDIPKAIKKNAEKGLTYFALGFDSSVNPDENPDINTLIDVTGEYLTRLSDFRDKYTEYNWVYSYDDNCYILLYYIYSDYSEEIEVDPEYSDIYDIIENVFN